MNPSATPAPQIIGLPELAWIPIEGGGDYDAERRELVVRSAARADWTNHATGGPQQHGSASLSFAAPDEPFMLSARMRVDGQRTTFDAAALTIWHDRDHWAKLCFESSPQAETMVVSVVTDTYSDDANSTVITDTAVFLRVSFLGHDAWAFHSSHDGETWAFVRLFRLPSAGLPAHVGFMSQAPLGDECVAVFDEIAFFAARLQDLRNGV